MRRLTPFAIPLLMVLAACAPRVSAPPPEPVTSLCPQIESVETRQPALVSMFVKVETCDGDPVTALSIANFTIFEDGNPISQSESRPDIFPVEREFRTATVLLLDLSGSVVRTGSLPELKAAAERFVETVLSSRSDIPNNVAVYWFDGSPGVDEQVGFTTDRAELLAGIGALSEATPQDESTNLNGAVIGGLEVLSGEQQRLREVGVPFTLASLVIFTDGTDQASRVTDADALEAVADAETGVLIQTVGLGGEINEAVLAEFGRDGFEFARNANEIAAAFERAGSRIRREANSFYLVRYCSPRRAGDHLLRVELALDQAATVFEEPFTADLFGPGCDPADASGELLSRELDPAGATPVSVTAEPARRFTFVCLENLSARHVAYLHRWADTPQWRRDTLPPEGVALLLWGLASAAPPPQLELRLNVAGGERIVYLSTSLEQQLAASPSCDGVPRYTLVEGPSGDLELTAGGS